MMNPPAPRRTNPRLGDRGESGAAMAASPHCRRHRRWRRPQRRPAPRERRRLPGPCHQATEADFCDRLGFHGDRRGSLARRRSRSGCVGPRGPPRTAAGRYPPPKPGGQSRDRRRPRRSAPKGSPGARRCDAVASRCARSPGTDQAGSPESKTLISGAEASLPDKTTRFRSIPLLSGEAGNVGNVRPGCDILGAPGVSPGRAIREELVAPLGGQRARRPHEQQHRPGGAHQVRRTVVDGGSTRLPGSDGPSPRRPTHAAAATRPRGGTPPRSPGAAARWTASPNGRPP